MSLVYCTISNCSAWPVIRDHCAEICIQQSPMGRVKWTNFGILEFWHVKKSLKFQPLAPKF